MIRSIPRITSFGVFADFHWSPETPEFKQYNLIYGWNYSGKTTLSRIFRCFELGQAHADFANATAQLRSADNAVHHLSSPDTAPMFRVFNSDFIRENLSFADGSATPILALGADDIAKQAALGSKREEREALRLSKLSNARAHDNKLSALEKALTQYARDLIKHPLAVPNYDKTRFEPKVAQCKDAYEKYLLDDDALSGYLAVHRSTEKKPTLLTKAIALSSMSQLVTKVAALLARVVNASRPIPSLGESSAVESWVNQGRPLHEGKNLCQFCGQSLPEGLMARLAGHFSEDYEDLMRALSKIEIEIEKAKEENVILDHKNELYSELSARFIIAKADLDRHLTARRNALESLATTVSIKKMKAFTRVECPEVADYTKHIVLAVDSINKIIAEHNGRTAEFDKKRKQAFSALERHYAAAFVRDEQYILQLQSIADLGATIGAQELQIGVLDREVRALEMELSEASRGAERINELLNAYFGRDDLRIVVRSDNRFQMVRGNVIAKNLSEGEKTAIAFAHFITRVQDGRHLLADIRIVIDDPISSLDANHLFNTYALIKTQLASCRQLFISTHSFEFYNLIREWVGDDEKDTRKPQAEWKKWAVFLVKRADDGKAVLEAIPRELLVFKSEYHYLFSILCEFTKAGAGDFDRVLSLPNVVRRFMEAFGGIMIPLSMGLHPKMKRLFPEEVVRERVWKFMNHYSHQTTITRSLIIPDMSECKAVVDACLQAVKSWDGDYFKDLEQEVS